MKKNFLPKKLLVVCCLLLLEMPVTAASSSGSTYGSPSSSPGGGHSASPQLKSPSPKKDQIPLEPPPRLVKKELSVMEKVIGMPGVVGFHNGKWEDSDYLGSLSNHIGVHVELVKTTATTNLTNEMLNANVREIFTKADLTPRAVVKEGPALPFLHILIVIYQVDKDIRLEADHPLDKNSPLDKDRFVIFGSVRLMEHIQVIRKDFEPEGYWQGITWESEQIAVATQAQLNDQITKMVSGLADGFVERYREYNPDNVDEEAPPELPSTRDAVKAKAKEKAATK